MEWCSKCNRGEALQDGFGEGEGAGDAAQVVFAAPELMDRSWFQSISRGHILKSVHRARNLSSARSARNLLPGIEGLVTCLKCKVSQDGFGEGEGAGDAAQVVFAAPVLPLRKRPGFDVPT